MRVLLLIALCIAAAAAQRLVREEVQAIIAATPNISIADCTKQCDDIFDLIDDDDEAMVDRECAHFCECEIDDHVSCRTGPGPGRR